jgi:hypothetical protein
LPRADAFLRVLRFLVAAYTQPSTPFGVDSTVFLMANETRIREMYDEQRRDPGYRRLMQTSKILGTWDDHDYGMNDGDRRYPYR